MFFVLIGKRDQTLNFFNLSTFKSYIKLQRGNKSLHNSQKLNSRSRGNRVSAELRGIEMGMAERGVVVVSLMVVVAMAAVEVSYGAVYKVGDSAGWTTIGNINYKKWSATKNFQVGDTIIFEYNSQFHNVMRVTHEMYKSCNASSPLATFSTGNDSIVIQNHGHHFFFCGVPGHCQAGQKVDINVPKVSATSSEAPTPSALASPTVPVPNDEPAPSPNQAPSMLFATNFHGGFAFLGLSMAFLFACS